MCVAPMPLDIPRVRAILLEVPRHGKLAYCLVRDPRVPAAPKVALLASLAVVVSPLDFPGWIPILGDFDMLALGILAARPARSVYHMLRKQEAFDEERFWTGQASKAQASDGCAADHCATYRTDVTEFLMSQSRKRGRRRGAVGSVCS